MIKPFEGLFGNNCELRMIEYLLPLEGIEFNVSELAEEVKVSRPSATKIIKKFLEWGLIEVKSKKQGTSYYSINYESSIVKNIQQLNNLLIEKMLGDEELYEICDYLESKKTLVKQDSINIFTESESKPYNCSNAAYTIPKPRIWWKEPSLITRNEENPYCNESRLNYLSGATT